MSAFGRKNGPGGMAPGARPSFGVARPMKGGGAEPARSKAPAPGGEQFPPLPGEAGGPDMSADSSQPNKADAMTRLADRANQVHEQKEVGGFEASV
ncbi:MAG: CpaF family protein, partial [Sphingomonadaceae bacterium]|nr:CpaF family protein [Sphingomonadaceae bacterium]